MSHLSVNLDLVAAMRETRRHNEPDPAQAAVLAELAGADGIVIQLRRDRKYIRDRDLYLLKGIVKTKLTFEMPPTDEFIARALEVKPWMVTLVADHTNDSNPVLPIDLKTDSVDFGDITGRFSGVGVNVCFFVEPEPDDIKNAVKAGASAVLINCAGYTEARTVEDAQKELDRIDNATQTAARTELMVHCGRGIGYRNVKPLVELGTVDEFVVGYDICARAMLIGIEKAVREMISLVRSDVARPE